VDDECEGTQRTKPTVARRSEKNVIQYVIHNVGLEI
jgi:hypothetical protein